MDAIDRLRSRFSATHQPEPEPATAAIPEEPAKPVSAPAGMGLEEVIAYSFTINSATKVSLLDAGTHYTITRAEDGTVVPALTKEGVVHIQQSIIMACSMAAGSDEHGLIPAPKHSGLEERPEHRSRRPEPATPVPPPATRAAAPSPSPSPSASGGRGGYRRGARKGSDVDVTGVPRLTGKRPEWTTPEGERKVGREFSLIAMGVEYQFTCWRTDLATQLQEGREVQVTGTSGWRSDDGKQVSISHPRWTYTR